MTTPAGRQPSISVIIVSYNVRDLLENCLHSVASALGNIASDVHVVDNQSDDGSVEMVQAKFPAVHLIANTENTGFAKANNQALRQARGSYIVLLNPDTLVQEDTFEILLDFFEKNPDTGLAGCKILRPDGTLYPACKRSFPSVWVSFTKLSGLSALLPRTRLFGRYNLTYIGEDETCEVDAVSGSFMMFRRSVYERIGGLDEDFFMYGEDLDFCFRVQKAGWKVFYIPKTKIVHYAGESTKRSSFDAKAVFYHAMELFARKNLRLSPVSAALLSAAIRIRLGIARSRGAILWMADVLADAAIVFLSLLAAEYFRYGAPFRLPSYAYPTIYIVTIAVYIVCLHLTGVYRRQREPAFRTVLGVLLSFLLLSSVTYFSKDYAFSRIVLAVSGAINFVLLPGRRILSALLAPQTRRNLITGNPTLLVGVNPSAIEILNRLQQYDANTYRIVGLVDTHRKSIGERIGGVEVVASVETIGKTIRDHRVTDVIIAPDVLPYTEILSMIGRTRNTPVHFRLVPKSMEFIVGKAGIDQLTSVPLVDVDFNLMRTSNLFVKRALDLTIAVPLTLFAGPFVLLAKRPPRDRFPSFRAMIRAMPAVLSGKKSLVGYPESAPPMKSDVYMGKPGLTGLIQIRGSSGMSEEEKLKLMVQYVRNHSLLLDVEILLRTCILRLFRKGV